MLEVDIEVDITVEEGVTEFESVDVDEDAGGSGDVMAAVVGAAAVGAAQGHTGINLEGLKGTRLSEWSPALLVGGSVKPSRGAVACSVGGPVCYRPQYVLRI